MQLCISKLYKFNWVDLIDFAIEHNEENCHPQVLFENKVMRS